MSNYYLGERDFSKAFYDSVRFKDIKPYCVMLLAWEEGEVKPEPYAHYLYHLRSFSTYAQAEQSVKDRNKDHKFWMSSRDSGKTWIKTHLDHYIVKVVNFPWEIESKEIIQPSNDFLVIL